MYDKHHIIYCLVNSLLNNITTHVRLITCEWEDDYSKFKLICYVDRKEISEEEELMECALTEFYSQISDFKKADLDVIFSDAPLRELETLKYVVFARHEGPVFGKWDPKTGEISNV